MKTNRVSVCKHCREELHARVDEILNGGDPEELTLLGVLLLEPVLPSSQKAPKKKGQPKRLP
jgi:hypothetical protein